MTRKFATIDDYINSCPPDVQIILEEVRRTIREAAPATEETISYQIPTFALDGTYVVHFAAWKSHLALYPAPTGDEAFEKEVAPYRAARSALHFPFGKPISHDLIRRQVRICVERREAKAQ